MKNFSNKVTKIVEEPFALVCSWCGNNIAANFVKDRSDDNKYICKSCGTACFMTSHTANADEIAYKIFNSFAEFIPELYKKIDEDGKKTRARIDSAEKNIINLNTNIQSLRTATAPPQTVNGTIPDKEKAIHDLIAAAEQGDANAQYKLGKRYYYGTGVTKNIDKALKWFKLAAEKDDADAQFMLGYCYYNGEGVDKNRVEAFKWFRLAAEKSLALAQYMLGVHYTGYGADRNYAEAVKWFRLSAEQGFPDAQYSLGLIYYYGRRVKRDLYEAFKWFKRAADNGHIAAQDLLGDCYYYGHGVDNNCAKAVKWYNLAAEQGHAEAQLMLGECYYLGRGIKKDRKEAVYWYSWIAEKNTNAQFRLGNCYQFGKGITKDLKKAISCYNSAAKKGHAAAQFFLGSLYFLGRGVAKDRKEAFKWIRSAALLGSEDAFKLLKRTPSLIDDGENYLCLGKCYYEGKSVKQSFDKALKYYYLSAENGNAVAQYMIGNIYYFGGLYEPGVYEPFDGRVTSFIKFAGVEKNHIEAVKWFNLAADNGHAEAQFMLGECYYNGYGVKQDYKEAAKWYELAAKQGHALAKHALEQIKKYL